MPRANSLSLYLQTAIRTGSLRTACGGRRYKAVAKYAEDRPLITVVTPVINGARYLEECLKSMAAQSYTNVEHIIIDGGSSDETLDILRDYDSSIDLWVSEPDSGMYDAIQKGFRLANGTIYSWLNADDVYYPYTLELVSDIFSSGTVRWLTGVPSIIDAKGRMVSIQNPKRYFRPLIARGYYRGDYLGFIQQESTFFSRDLYDRVRLSTQLKLAGDYDLWRQMAKCEKLYSLKTVLASFRRHDDQLSTNLDQYYLECDSVAHPRWKALRYVVGPLSVLLEHQLLKYPDFVRQNPGVQKHDDD